FAAKSLEREDRDEQNDQRRAEREPAIAQNEIREWLISPDQKTVNRVFLFRCDFPANEQRHQHWHECDAKKRGKEHGECFCKGERPEEPALLRCERKDRDKAYWAHKQRNTPRAPYPLC